MKCRRCGRDIIENATHCTFCNAPVVSVAQSKVEKKYSVNKGLLIGILVLAVLLLAVFGVFIVRDMLPSGNGGSGGGGSASIGSTTNEAAFDMEVSRHAVSLWSKDNVVYLYAHTKGVVDSVSLIDENGGTVKPMYDDGKTNGDEVEGDGIFTTKLRMDTTEEGNYEYYALTDNSVRSQSQFISVVKSLTDGEIAKMGQVDNALASLKSSNSYKKMSNEEKAAALEEKLYALVSKSLIEADSIIYNKDGEVFTFCYISGVVGAVKLYDFLDVEAQRGIKMNVYSGDAFTNYADSANFVLKNADAKILYAWGAPYSQAISDANVYKYTYYLKNACKTAGYNATVDENVTIEDLKKLANQEYVYIGAHGLMLSIKRNADDRYWYGSRDAAKTVTSGFALMEACSEEKDKKYALDLKSGRIFRMDGVYFITPGFFDEYYKKGDLKDSIFFFGGAQIMGVNNSMCEDWSVVLENKNVKAMVGFYNTAYINYGQILASDVALKLGEGMSIEQALTLAKAQNGNSDAEWFDTYIAPQDTEQARVKEAAYAVMRGDVNARAVDVTQ